MSDPAAITIEEFERRIHAAFSKTADEEDDGGLYGADLQMHVHADGCLGARWGADETMKTLPTEGVPWGVALAIIAKHVEDGTADL